MTPTLIAIGFLLFSAAVVGVAVALHATRTDEAGNPVNGWAAEQRRRRLSVYGYERCPACGDATVLDGECWACARAGRRKRR